MQKTVNGEITAADISVMGKLRYGYLGIETDSHEHLKVKVTAFTEFETLDVGSKVQVELESVGAEALLTAKKITTVV
jgi:hypothetical protein